MLYHKNILNGLSRAVYGGKPHNVPKALQSVNMKNTSERGEGGGQAAWSVCVCMHRNADMWLICPTLQLVCMLSLHAHEAGHKFAFKVLGIVFEMKWDQFTEFTHVVTP